VNEPPIIANESSYINQGQSITINLLDNDTDPENDQLMLSAVDAGTVSFTADGKATFTPNESFFGTIVISYTVQDNAGNSVMGQWTVHVTEVMQIVAKTQGGGALQFFALWLLLIIAIRRQYQKYEK